MHSRKKPRQTRKTITSDLLPVTRVRDDGPLAEFVFDCSQAAGAPGAAWCLAMRPSHLCASEAGSRRLGARMPARGNLMVYSTPLGWSGRFINLEREVISVPSLTIWSLRTKATTVAAWC